MFSIILNKIKYFKLKNKRYQLRYQLRENKKI